MAVSCKTLFVLTEDFIEKVASGIVKKRNSEFRIQNTVCKVLGTDHWLVVIS